LKSLKKNSAPRAMRRSTNSHSGGNNKRDQPTTFCLQIVADSDDEVRMNGSIAVPQTSGSRL
jgi:hypothetical protein